MNQTLESHPTSGAWYILRRLIGFQFAVQTVIFIDQSIRYVLRSKARTRPYGNASDGGVKFEVDDGFALLAVHFSIAYTVLWSYIVFGEDPNVLYESQIALQCTLVATQLSQAFLSKRFFVRERKRLVHGCLVVTSLLGALSIATVALPPSAKSQTCRGGIITAAMISNELLVASVLVYCLKEYRKINRMGVYHSIAWIFRAATAVVTAFIGGFYLDTFWSLWSPQVVLLQQINMLSSMVITGLSSIAAIRGYIRNRRERRAQSAPSARYRSSSNLICKSQPNRDKNFGSRDELDSQSTNGLVSDSSGAVDTRTSHDTVAEVEFTEIDKITVSQLQRLPTEFLEANNFELTVNTGRIDDEEQEQDQEQEDVTSDEYETQAAQKWSTTVQSDTYPVVAENNSQASADIKIIGVMRRFDRCGVKWWYQTLQDDMMVYSESHGLFDTPYSHASVFALPNGYCFVHFSPKWVRCREVPEPCRRDFWNNIGAKFWGLMSDGDIVWDGKACLYENKSNGWKQHLCAERDCEKCRRVLEPRNGD